MLCFQSKFALKLFRIPKYLPGSILESQNINSIKKPKKVQNIKDLKVYITKPIGIKNKALKK